MKRLTGGIVALLVGYALAGPTTALAADVTIPIDTVIASGVAEGGQVELALVSSNGLAGETCGVRAVHRGNGPVHSGNDLIVTSGDDTATLTDVEREPGAVTEGTTAITLANLITIELAMGPDQHFAGDIDVELDCGAPIAAVRAAPERSEGSDLPLTGGQIMVTITIGAALIAGAAVLMAASRRRTDLPGSSDT